MGLAEQENSAKISGTYRYLVISFSLTVGVVLAVASHPSENIIASGSLDKEVILWFQGDAK